MNRKIGLEDLADFDAALYQNLKWLSQNTGAEELSLTFRYAASTCKWVSTASVIVIGSVNDPDNPSQLILLKPNGNDIVVTDENKEEYIELLVEFHVKVCSRD